MLGITIQLLVILKIQMGTQYPCNLESNHEGSRLGLGIGDLITPS
jgi:hypothetical protein